MIRKINAAMLELQSATLARSLYPEGHPRIRASEERAMAMLAEVFVSRPEVTVFAVDDRVVFGDLVLPSSPSLVNSMFSLLRRRGVDHISLRKGLDPGELADLLDDLSSHEEEPPRPIRPSAHVSFGAIVRQDVKGPAPTAARPAESSVSVEQVASALSESWTGIHEMRDVDIDLLGDVVSTLARSVSDTSCAILPLAFVKGYDEYTYVHIINVGILTMALGEAVGFDAKMTQELGIAALLHDVGKMAVPLEVLNKNGRFTDAEYKQMQIHPVEGARMLLRTRGVPDLATVVAYEHHVRYDGGGYPKVPPGWKLNLASRICQIADVYDALRTDRPYRPGMPVEKITKIMKGDSGTYFDPELLTIFLEHVMPRAPAGRDRQNPAEAGAAAIPGDVPHP